MALAIVLFCFVLFETVPYFVAQAGKGFSCLSLLSALMTGMSHRAQLAFALNIFELPLSGPTSETDTY